MKKFASFFLMLSLMAVCRLPGMEAVPMEAQDLQQQQVLCSDDDYLMLECQLRPIQRKSKSTTKKGMHLYKYGSLVTHQASFGSLNWSGYVAVTGTQEDLNPTYGSVKEVSGAWIVPGLTASQDGDTYSAAWVGIDGFTNFVVEQIGTEHDVIDNLPVYYAWFELYPAGSQLIEGFPVFEGDKIEAKVTYRGKDESFNDIFRLAIKNHTRKVKFEIHQSTLPGYPAHLSSANWIVETPAENVSGCTGFLPLANFGTICFKNCEAVINERRGPIGDKHWTYAALTMITTNQEVKDVPSALIPGRHNRLFKKDGFKVLWQSSGPFPYDLICDN